MHTVVVGGGIIGAAAAHALAGRDGSVTLLEARRIGHADGSSHGPSRILRLTYQATDYIDLLRLAYPAWDALGEEAGERLRIPCGGLDFGPPGAHHVAEMRTAMRAGVVRYEDVDADAIRAAYPQLNVADDTDGYLQPDYSLLAADRCLAVLVAGARERGATVREGVGTTSVAVDGDGVAVRIADGTVVRADRVVLAAGSWIGPLAAQLGLALPLTVLKEQLAFFEPADASRFEPGRFPLFITRVPGSTSLGSGFPILGEPWGVKCMVDRIGPSVAPDDTDRTIDEATLADLTSWALATINGLTGRVTAASSCRYTMTPDEDFILGLHPEHRQVIIASCCSGHGFKFAPTLGEIAADLATTGASSLPIARFRLGRDALQGDWSAT